jgi:uncharacterized membrane protein YccC
MAMSYVNRELKIMIGIIVGFIIGISFTAIISPQICNNKFLVFFTVIGIIGFPILLCTRNDLKSLLITVGILIVIFILLVFLSNMRENYEINRTLNSFQHLSK